MLVFVMPSCLFLAALWLPTGRGLASWLSCAWCFLVFLSLFYAVYWVGCGAWLFFFCFVALHPKSTAMVIAGRSVHLTTLFPGQA